MQNNFSKCREWVPRGTSQHKWRWLTTLLLILTFAIGNVWADSETVPKTTDNWTGTSCKLTHAECANGSTSAQKDGDASSVTYIKFRTNKNGNTMTFEVNEGYKVTGFSMRGFANDKAKAVELASVKYDSADPIAVGESFPNKNAGTTYTYSNTTNEATSSIVLSFGTNAGTQIMAVITITYEEVSSGPVDPTITFNDGAYTVGATALDLSTLFSSNSSGAVTYTVKTDGDTHATIDGNNFSATDAGTCVVTATQAAVAGTYNQKAVDANIVVSAAVTPACPSGISISGTTAYTEGETIELTAALTEGNGEISYQWYKGSIEAGNEVGTNSNVLTIASCATTDAGNYFCVATKDACPDAESAAYAVTVAAATDPWIIKVALSGSAGATRTMSGSIGGTADASGLGSSSPYKIGGDAAYVSLTLSTGYFYPGDSVVLDLSKTGQIFYGATDNDNDHLLGTTTAKDGIHYFILPASFPANTNTIHVGRTSSTYNGTLSYMAVYRTPICPQTLTISGETDYVPGDKIELTASLAKGNGAITYQWYKGGTAEGDKLTGKTNAKLEIEDCVAGDAGDYYCIASKEDCSDAVNAAAYTITVNDFVAVTGITISPASPTVEAKSKITLTAEVAPVEATNKVVEWSVKSGSEAYASVNATTGEVTGKAEGNAVIVATATDGSGVFAEKTVVVTPFVCPTSGTIYSFVSDGTKAPGSNTYCPASGVKGVVDIATYATVSGGLAQGVHTTTSNNPIQIQTSTSAVKLSHADGYFRALLECPLQEGDTIKFEKTNKVKMAFDSLRTKVVEIASGTGANKDYYIVPATYAGEDTIMVYYGGSSVNLTALRVIRPAKYAVTFNMHGHGDAVDPQTILKGGKVSEPADPSASGWDFGGWFKESTYDNEWDFDNDVVSAATELHAKWTEHVLSNNVALGTLTVNGEDVAIVPSQLVYAVELPFGTTAIPTVAATAADANAKACNVTQALAVDGSATIYVKAEDNTTEATYTINFSVATSKDIQLVFKTGTTPCVGSASTSTQILSNNAAVSTYINQIAFTNVEGAGDNGAEGGSLNVGKKAGNMFTLSAKPGYAFQAMNFLAKIQDATCEYSIDGGAWSELASTNTGGDECYAPFSAAEVHEFRLRSTGTSGVWIRNMQLTIVEACTPITIAWDEEPVEFEVGKAGYAIAATANNGGDITYATADNTIIDVNASTGALTIAGLGSATLSASTAEGNGTTYCANGGNPIVINKVVNTYYLVSFDADNGDAVVEHKYYAGGAEIALPANPVKSGYDFQGWFNGSDEITSAITPTASMNIVAHWQTSYAAMIGTTGYTTFAAAAEEVADGQTIQLLQNCSYADMWAIAGMTVTLDLNGNNLTYTGSGRAVEVQAGGNLVLEDASATVAPTIDLTQDPLDENAVTYTSGVFELVDGIRVINGGALTINSGRYEATEGVALVKFTGSTVTVNDGVLISRDNGVIMGNGTTGQGGYIMNINGGILIGKIVTTGYASMVVYHPNEGELNITGGTLVSTNGPAVVVRGGESDITGGTIIAQGSGSGKCGDASLVLPAVGVAYDFKSAYPGVSSIDATISGTANVSGEAGAVKAVYADAEPTAVEESKVNISGGTFNSALTKAVCAENYVPKDNGDGTYGVQPKQLLCLAWVDVTGQNAASLDASKSFLAPEISASGIKNSSSYGGKTGWKFNSAPGYIAIENAEFEAGDVVEMFVTTTTGDAMRVYKANTANDVNQIGVGAANMVLGVNQVALTADANNLYLRRGDDFDGWNPFVAYVAVYRAYPNPLVNTITFNGAAGTVDNDLKTITVEVPASTVFSTMPIVATFLSNDPNLTNGAVTGTWAEGDNEYIVTDKDGDQTVYTVTISKAAASSDATLSTLNYGGTAIALADGVYEYDVELPYGTSAVPALAATVHHAGASITETNNAAAFVNRQATSTITITAEDGTTTQTYTVNFTITAWNEVVIWDGSTMDALKTSPDATTGLAWAVNGFGSISSYNTTYGEKAYTKYLPSGGTAPGRYMTLTVPAGYVAKFYVVMASHSDGSERGMFIGSNLVKDPDATSVLQLSNNDRDEAVAGMSEIVGAGTYYINPNASVDFQEIRAYVRPGYARTAMLGDGVLGTVCVDHNVAIEDIQGVTVYELMGREPEFGKLAFDEIVSGELEAGAPYVFQAHGDKMIMFYGETSVAEPVDKGNGMYGTFVDQTLTELDDVYYFAQRALWSCVDLSSLSLPANRAYVKLSEIDYLSDPNPAPGRRRITMTVNGEKVATDIENLNASETPVKLIINGQMYILRGEKMFDATGRLVK